MKKKQTIKFSKEFNVNTSGFLSIDRKPLEVVDRTVFLYITINSKLQWNSHIVNLAGILSLVAYAVRTINKRRCLINEKTAYY